ncbi:DUF3396 domain-containing protein [Pyxidicoccus parkwayensis]|jgi:Type VI immunity for VRR-NUC|uniref:DUF3396 domain-containing protein n=1 Tax=Pyxidicoccus parkwayensis TaxID=2813578 RepID=A0ABX7P8J2_9BACT|nr:DUF3396 domain-containing protein [Pyxidicoccus parkwaysis]QSQ26829.1 DUF3396 domain-containing protein [Pyxidicoccus parkwaysis]
MSERYPRVRVMAENGYTLAREAVHICFYMHRPYVEVAPDLLRALDVFVDAVGSQTLGLYADSEGEWQELDEAGWKHIRSWLSGRLGFMSHLRDTSRGNAYVFESYGKPANTAQINRPDATCAAYFRIPTELMEEHGPGWVRTLALQLAGALPFSTGHAGLAIAGDLDLVGVSQRLRPYVFRYPGLDVLPMLHVSWEIGTKVRGPAWLTFLGQPALNGLGGIAALRDRLHSPGTTVEPLGNDSAVITLGDWPEAGDTEQGKTLPAYRELARVLEPWLFREEHPNAMNLSFTPEELLRWERRFLD